MTEFFFNGMKYNFCLVLIAFSLLCSSAYAENICSSTSSTADSGRLYDSGGSGNNYSNNEDCGFLIQPASSASITLSFSQFNVETGWDYLYVYDGTSTAGTFLGRFTGRSLPNNLTATSGSMYLRFDSDFSITRSGFAASWTSISSSIPAELEWRMDETSWDGTVNEVFDSTSNARHGTARNGAITSNVSPAITGSQGTCSYGIFDGVNDYIESSEIYDLLKGTASLTFWVRTTQTGNNTGYQAPGVAGIEVVGSTNDIFWGWLDASGHIGISVGDVFTSKSNTAINDGNFHHISLSRNASSGEYAIYIDGILDKAGTIAAGTIGTSFSSIGRIEDTGSTPEYFQGDLDEVRIFSSVLTQTEVQAVMNEARTCPVLATLIASYNFDDEWITNNNLPDQTNSYDGSPAGSLSRVSAGASGLKGDTCYAGSFSGGEIDISGLPVSTSTGDNTSVSFWMYWDGTKNVMPIGWYQHDLFFGANNSGNGSNVFFGFNTWGWDVTGISSTGLSSGWHHVSAVFTNGIVASNKLYIDGVLQSISHQTGSVSNSNAFVNSSLRIGGATSTSFWHFSGLLDNFKVYTGEITQSQVTADMNESNDCSGGGGGDTVASSFNCVENGLDGITGKLYTKAVNQNFAFDIIALQDVSTVETSFADGTDHTVTVELVDASSGSCATYSSLNPAVSQNVVFTASDAGSKSSASMSSATAYSNVRCRMTDSTNSPAVVGCSTDAFAIRPTDFSVISNLTNSTATGTPTAKAGDNFTLTVTASSGYNGTPKIDAGKVEAHSGAVQTGTLSGTFASANSSNGQATGNTFTYTEAGSLRFAPEGIYDDTFTAIDQSDDCTNDYSNTPVSGKIGCKFANNSASNYFGRFTPDHFDVSLNTPVFSPACGNFTYVGQPVKYTTRPTVTVTAKNNSGNTTQNYTGNFWKIVPTDSTYGITPSYTEASHGLSVLDNNSPTLTDNGNGTGILTFADTSNNILGISRGNPEAEFDAEIGMAFNLSDTDGITVSNVDGSPQTNPISFGAASAGNGISFGGNKTQRWGRIAITNAHGSELSMLPVPLQTEYFNGTDFIPNSDDNCTTVNLSSQITLSNPVTSGGASLAGNTAMTIGSGTSSATLLNNPVSSGSSSLNFSAPGAGNTGYIDISSSFSSFPWMLFDWDNDSSHNDSPSGKATFGVFNGSPEQIYFREVY